MLGEGEFVSRFGNFVSVRDLCHHKFVREIMQGDDEHDEHQVKDHPQGQTSSNTVRRRTNYFNQLLLLLLNI